MQTRVKTATELEAQRESGRMLATVMNVLEGMIAPGISERELADVAARELRALGGQPTFKGYNGFPDVICISTNQKVVHGIPGDYVLQDGDIVSLDFGVTYRGMVTDHAQTFEVGRVNPEIHELVVITKRSLDAGIAVLHDGVRVGDIAAAVQAVVDKKGYGIVRELVGHGVGHHLHEGPDIPNYGRPGTGPVLKAGMTIAIEPMVNLGSDAIVLEDDRWTISTRDGKPSAHFEHTVLITDDGAEILTQL
jgi:methionyl aminopeptidase